MLATTHHKLFTHHFISLALLFVCAVPGTPVLASDKANDWSQAVARDARFWIGDTGPTGPIFTGPQQYPFICTTVENGLGQPLIDNHAGVGNAVFPEINGLPDYGAAPSGYSQFCSLPTRVDYLYYSTTAHRFLPLPNPAEVPADVEQLSVNGQLVSFVVRLERGTINRFIYSIAMLAPYPESLARPRTLNNAAWNHKLVYKFEGGVGIGHFQGFFSLDADEALHYASLQRGYAVAYSTGTRTGTHYNLNLAEETALMLKAHFKAVYGHPDYTVGIGGSGGGVQQYVIGQNNPQLIDAAIPQLSYPDMITQTMYVGDCELLERFFDVEYTLNHASRWSSWLDRGLIEGLATNQIAIDLPWSLSPYAPAPGSSGCIHGWRGSVPAVLNPFWTDQQYLDALALYRYPPDVIATIKWTHWNDLGNIYPQDANGFAPNSWDNVGVQYGLRPLLAGSITPQEFLDLNACVGGWKPPQQMQLGFYPWDPTADPATFDPWDQRNMNLSPLCQFGGPPAPRTAGSLDAMHAAYNSGHVFEGKLDIPIFDIRYYLDPILDMHHSQASFAARARLRAAKGNADNQIIWFIACPLDPVNLDDNCAIDPTGQVLDIVADWLSRARGHSAAQVINFKPAAAVDACLHSDGSVLYAGNDAWDGILNDKPKGPCASAFPIHSTSRIEAGENQKGDIFKCARKPVATALNDGTYGNVAFSVAQQSRLQTIFADGVCDYTRGDVGKPTRPYH
jgi:Tannase-like family of unknown function (DUF6351)